MEEAPIPYIAEFRKPKPDSPKKKWYFTFICPECGVETTKAKHTNMVWLCNTCSRKTIDADEFIRRAREKFGDLYDYSKTEYTGSLNKVVITCRIHGDFSMRPFDHLRKGKPGKCPKCSFIEGNQKKRFSIKEWEHRLLERTGGDVTIVSYDTVGYHNKVTLKCEIHGEFESTFGYITHSLYVCPECARVAHRVQPNRANAELAKLYYVYIPEIDMYKLRVTTHSRSSSLSGFHYETILEQEMPYDEAVQIEYELHRDLTHLRYQGKKKLIRAGNTELYKVNIIEEIHKKLENRAS